MEEEGKKKGIKLLDVVRGVKNYSERKATEGKVTLHDVDEATGRMMWKYTTPEGKTYYSDVKDDLVGIAVMFELRAKARSKLGKVI